MRVACDFFPDEAFGFVSYVDSTGRLVYAQTTATSFPPAVRIYQVDEDGEPEEIFDSDSIIAEDTRLLEKLLETFIRSK